MRWLFFGGIMLGLAVASRKSMLALGLVPLALILIESGTWKQRVKNLLVVGIGFLLIVGVLLGWAYYQYGEQGLWEVTGYNSAADGINAVDPSEADQVRAYNLRGMTPFFRESLPLIIASLLGFGLLLESFIREAIRRSLKASPARFKAFLLGYLIPKLFWVLPGGVFAWAGLFFFQYEGSVFIDKGGMRYLWYAFVVTLVLIAIWPRTRKEKVILEPKSSIIRSTQPRAFTSANPPNVPNRGGDKSSSKKIPKQAPSITVGGPSIRYSLSAVLITPLWLLGLLIFYLNWFKFHANYLGEFLPPLAILVGPGIWLTWTRLHASAQLIEKNPILTVARRIITVLFVFMIIWAMYLSNFITNTYEHTGTFDYTSAEEAASWAQDNIPADESIFTGAALIPYLSGHHVALDIAHPRWYAYQFTRDNPDRLNTFLPPAEAMLEAYDNTTWLLLEKQTGFSFLMEYSKIEAGIEEDFELVHTVENLSNPLKFYRRVK